MISRFCTATVISGFEGLIFDGEVLTLNMYSGICTYAHVHLYTEYIYIYILRVTNGCVVSAIHLVKEFDSSKQQG